MTSVLMIFEMTQDYAVIVPLMIVTGESFHCFTIAASPFTKRWPCRTAFTCRRRRRANDLVSVRWSE